jgi:hypothetical protein
MAKRLIIHRNYPRKQHVIPRGYLDYFADKDGRLFVYEKSKPVRQSIAKKEAVERDYFECKIPGYETNFAIEERLSRIESAAAPAHSKFVNGKSLTDTEKASWALYVASTFLRSRRVRIEMSSGTFNRMAAEMRNPESYREDQWKWFKQTGQLVSQEKIQEATERVLGAFGDPALRQNNTIEFSTPNLARVLGTKRWQIISPADGQSFVTCDAPVFTFSLSGKEGSIGGGWGLPDSHIAMPLSPNHLFIASPSDLEWHAKADDTNTKALIDLTTRFADRYVYASEKLSEIQVMIDKNGGTLIFGKDAYIKPKRAI